MDKHITKTNELLLNLVVELKKTSTAKKAKIWKAIALELLKPTRKMREVNIDKINRVTKPKAIISGSKEVVVEKYLWRDNLGEPFKVPFMPKIPMKFFKRVIRGMISYKKERGKLAYKRIKCYPGNPKNVKGITLENAKYTKLKKGSYITVGELCKHLKK